MKPWNAWVACLGCAGLCLALVGCGGNKEPESDLGDLAAQGGVASPPPSTPPAVAQNETQPAPAEPAPTPAPAPEVPAATAPEVAASETATAPTKTEDATAKTESLATNKPAEDATKASEQPAAMPNTPAAATSSANAPTTPVAETKPNPAPEAEADNPFAVFETQPNASGTGKSTSPAAGGTETATEGIPADANPPAEGDRPEGALGFLNAAGAGDRGSSTGLYRDPSKAAMTFLKAVKEKDLAKIAEATALHAPFEAKGTSNQRLFTAILEQDLSQEDLDEFAKKLDGYTFAGVNAAKSSGQFGVIVTKPEGTSIMRRTITMRHEKAGWKVQDISGQGEIEKPIVMPRMGGGMGGRR